MSITFQSALVIQINTTSRLEQSYQLANKKPPDKPTSQEAAGGALVPLQEMQQTFCPSERQGNYRGDLLWQDGCRSSISLYLTFTKGLNFASSVWRFCPPPHRSLKHPCREHSRKELHLRRGSMFLHTPPTRPQGRTCYGALWVTRNPRADLTVPVMTASCLLFGSCAVSTILVTGQHEWGHAFCWTGKLGSESRKARSTFCHWHVLVSSWEPCSIGW